MFAQSFLIRFCMIYVYTRPRYQARVYRTIGPLVSETTGPFSTKFCMLFLGYKEMKIN